MRMVMSSVVKFRRSSPPPLVHDDGMRPGVGICGRPSYFYANSSGGGPRGTESAVNDLHIEWAH